MHIARTLLTLLAAAVLAIASAQERTLIIAVANDIQNLDPTLSSGDTLTQEVLTSVYSYLIDFERYQNADGDWIGDADSFVGDVAESFEFSDDGREVRFTIREGITFSNGDPIDVHAVKFTYDRIFGQQGVTAFLTSMAAVTSADHVRIVDERTIAFDLDVANTLLLGNMAQFGHSILNPNVVRPHMTDADPYAHEWLRNNTAGTESGPYVIERWDRGNEIVLARNPNYWGTVENDRVILKIIPDPSSRLAQVRAGSVDVAMDIPLKDMPALERDANVDVARFTTRAVGYLGMNNEIPPFDNVDVRRAISYAIPYETIIDNVLNGYGIQLTSPIPFGTPYHTDEFFVYREDHEEARRLLAAAGHPDGFSATFTIPAGNAEAREGAVWVQSSLRNIGIDLTIEEMPGAAFTERMQQRDHAFFWANQWISISNDPFYHVFWLLKADCCNYGKYRNDRVWELIDTYTLSVDEEARAAAAREIQELAVGEAAWVFLFQPDELVAKRTDIEGYTWYSADRYMRFQYLWSSNW